MKIVSWNMGCAPIRARYRRTQTEAWRYLLDTLAPDIAFVQEALRETTAVTPTDGTLHWAEKCVSDKTESGTAVFVRRGIPFKPLPVTSEGSYVSGVLIYIAGVPTLFISIHVGPTNYRKHLRALAATVSSVVPGHRFVVGGDLNAARHWDIVHNTKWYGRFFADLAARQMVDCHWQQHQKEVQSLWRKQDKNGYQCDHIFADHLTAQDTDCNVLPNVERFSDHSPIELVAPKLNYSAIGLT